MKYTNFIGLMCLALCSCIPASFAQNGRLSDENAYALPTTVSGVAVPVLSLNGNWQFRYSPTSKWSKIEVPGEAAMQGYAIEHDKPFFYKKIVVVPSDFSGKHIVLRFDGVYSYAKLSVNGTAVREHHGGFTRWETDITPYIKPGKQNEIQLEIVDRKDDISYASGYAHHPIGGILRDVTLFALPQTCIYDLNAETHLDSLFQQGELRFQFDAVNEANAQVRYTLTAPDGKNYPLAQPHFAIKNGQNEQVLTIKNPIKWDAEHPNLYTLTVDIDKDGKKITSFTKQIGFRTIKIEGNKMLVNGNPVKLRGACRHDIHPTLGRTTTAELDSLDALLFKRSNMNFVRTSHYPPTERFIEFCNRYGIYVECETAVCFVDTHRQKNYAPGATQDSVAFTDRYLSQNREMVKSFRTHPSIVLWSIGNECAYGSNFQKSWDYVKATDQTRPVIFSYPGTLKDKKPIFDILSMHYQDVNGNLSQLGMKTQGFEGHGIPALFDEWAHPACYTYETLQKDPNIREFWGHSLEKMWSGLFDAPGGLGGAIWGYIDETFMLPEPVKGTAFWKEFARTAKPENYQGNCVGYGEWGIVDVWRREKPEFWGTKKAYSPIRLLETQVASVQPGERLLLPIYNRFDHTSLNEVEIRYTYNEKEKKMVSPAVLPHQKGLLVVPGENWQPTDSLLIGFYDQAGELIDMEQITLGETAIKTPVAQKGNALTVTNNAEFITVKGDHFVIPFSKTDGLITNATANNELIIEKGPFVNLDINLNHLTGAEVRKTANRFRTEEKDWKLKDIRYTENSHCTEVIVIGQYKEVAMDFHFYIYPNGSMKISYIANGHPNGFLRETGLAFLLPDQFDQLKWNRKGMWSYYPEGSFAGNSGQTPFYNNKTVAYGENPNQPWQADTHNYYYWADAGANCKQPLTQMAKGMKENIYQYTLSGKSQKGQLSVYSPDASLACRLNKRSNDQLVLFINNGWDYPEIAWGNYCKTLQAIPCHGEIDLFFNE